jgi:hypothetical protein
MLRSLSFLSFLAALALLVQPACGGDDDGGGDSGSQVDAGSGGIDAAPGSGHFTCGDENCDLDTQECCVGESGPSCVESGSCEGPAFTCDGPEDCGDTQSCCAAEASGEGGTACASQGECGGSVVCHTADDCADGEDCCDPAEQGMSAVGGFCATDCPGPA